MNKTFLFMVFSLFCMNQETKSMTFDEFKERHNDVIVASLQGIDERRERAKLEALAKIEKAKLEEKAKIEKEKAWAEELRKKRCANLSKKLVSFFAVEEFFKMHQDVEMVYFESYCEDFGGHYRQMGSYPTTQYSILVKINDADISLIDDTLWENMLPFSEHLIPFNKISSSNGERYEASMSKQEFLKHLEDAKFELFSKMQEDKCVEE